MKPTPGRRKTVLLLSGAALWSILCSQAGAEDAPATAREFCEAPSTIDCARREMITNDQLRSAVAANSLTNHLEKIFREFSAPDPEAYAAARKRLDGIVRQTESQAAEMGIASPALYVTAVNTHAVETREGTRFILINKNAFRLAVLTDDGAQRMKAWISRELARILNTDTSPAAIADHHNNPASARQAGLRADLEGAGPLGAKDPIAATAAIEFAMREELQTRLMFAKGNTVDDIDPNRLSDREYKRISDEHQRTLSDRSSLAPWDRVTALRREAHLMAEYERTHTVGSHADREAESKWLVDQILPDAIRGGQ